MILIIIIIIIYYITNLLVQKTVDNNSPRSFSCEQINASVDDTSFGKSVSSIDLINNFKFDTHSFTFELNFSINLKLD